MPAKEAFRCFRGFCCFRDSVGAPWNRDFVDFVEIVGFGGYREIVISLISLQPRRARPVDEAAKARLAAQPSRVQRTKQARRSRGSGLSFARARRRPKQKQGTATRSSAPVFASGHCPAPRKSAKRKRHEQRPLPVAETGSCEWRSAPVFASIILDAPRKSAKRKRAYVTASTAYMCLTVLRSARSSVAPLGQRGREGVSIPPPYPLWTPYPPLNDQGMSPWTQKRKVAPGVWLKKLFTARQRYCASLFPGSSHSARPADETAE